MSATVVGRQAHRLPTERAARPDPQAEGGQAAVETALTLPLTLFLILGTLQLFMLLQGRLMAEHAVYKAVRVGSVNHGDCRSMTHAAVAALLPSFSTFLGTRTQNKLGASSPAEALAAAWRLRTQGQADDNRFDPVHDDGHDRAIVWLYRESPARADVTVDSEHDFDDPDPVAGRYGYRLEVRLVYWFPLRIPFANWVMSAMFRSYFGLQAYTAVNPLLPARDADWSSAQASNRITSAIAAEYTARHDLKQYTFPITASYAMRMMTPPRAALFTAQNCPGAR